MRLFRLGSPCLLASVLAAQQDPAPAPAASPAPLQQEPRRVVVTASGLREDELDTPYTFQRLDNRDITDRGYRTLPEALAQVPGVMVQKTTHGHGSPYIRGFTGRYNLLLIDGVRLPSAIFRNGSVQYWNTVDAFMLDHLEVVKSQGSVLFGSDAVGGTVNLVSKSSAFRERESGRAFWHGAALYRFDSNGGSHTGRLESEVGEGGRWGLHLGVTYRDFGDVRDRVLHEMEHTGYDEFDYDGRFDLALGDDATLTIAHQRVQQDGVWRTHNTVFFESWQGTSQPNPDLTRIYDQDRDLTYLKVSAADRGGVVDAFRLTFSYQNQREDFERSRLRSGNTELSLDRTTVATAGVALAMESALGDARLVYGLDYYRDDVDSRRNVQTFDPSGNLLSSTLAVQGPYGDDAFLDLAGAYAQLRQPLGDAVELTMGARYTYAAASIGRLDDGNGNPVSADKHWDNLSGNLRANVRVTEELHLYGGVSQAFRAPNVDDLSSLKPSRTGVVSRGSLDLDPERFVTWELGGRFLAGGTTVQAAAYYTDVTDLITEKPVGVDPGDNSLITATTNGADGYLWGGEVQVTRRLWRRWQAAAFAAYVDGEADTFPSNSAVAVREPISRLMPLTGWLSLRWTDADERLWIEGRVVAAGHAGRLNSGDRADTSRFPPGGTPSYVVAFVSAGLRVDDHTELGLTIENVTDSSYRVHGSGVNQPGCNAIVGGRFSW
ncbi:MAG: TonB-dependent receptor [Planctomycetes bacterium]|nr:TonB-dependent receptor [Planctomycetota bacterium]